MKITIGQLRQIIKEAIETLKPMPPFVDYTLARAEREADAGRPRETTKVVIFNKNEIQGLNELDLEKMIEEKLPMIKGLGGVKFIFGFDPNRTDEAGEPGVYFAQVTYR